MKGSKTQKRKKYYMY